MKNVDEVRDEALRFLNYVENPDEETRAIMQALELKKRTDPEWWRRMAKKLYGLRTAKAAELLVPLGVAVQARMLGIATDGQRWLDKEGEFRI